jgi:hypothetical protein
MTLDSKFAAGMRQQLVDTAAGTSRLARHVRHARLAGGLVAGLAAASLLTAGAVIAVSAIPGDHVITPVSETISQSHVGSATVELGPRPDTANAVRYVLTCTSVGKIEFHTSTTEGGYMICGPGGGIDPEGNPFAPVGNTMTVRDQLLADGATSFEVTADPGMSWTVAAKYVHTETTNWGVNANGQTYGTANEKGTPDLEAVMTADCKFGYTLTEDSMALHEGDQPYSIPVYKSDGETVIGEFWFGNNMPFCDEQ